MPLIRTDNDLSCYVGDGSKIVLADTNRSMVLFDTLNGKYTKLESPEIEDQDDAILYMKSFSKHLLVYTRKGDLYVYDFKDHDWQKMPSVKNFLILKSEKLLVTYSGRYEVYNKNFLLIFFKDIPLDQMSFMTLIE